jgi:hypothetical protein
MTGRPSPHPQPDAGGLPVSADPHIPVRPGDLGGTRPRPDDGLTAGRPRKDIERRPRGHAAASVTALMERSSW